MNKYIFYKKKKILGISKNIYRIGKYKKEYLKYHDHMIHVDEYIKKFKNKKQLKIKKGAGFRDSIRRGYRNIMNGLDYVEPEPTANDILSLYNLIQKHLGWFDVLRQEVADLKEDVIYNDNRIKILEEQVKSLLRRRI